MNLTALPKNIALAHSKMIKYTFSYNISSKMNNIYLENLFTTVLFHEVLCTTNKQKKKKTLNELLPRITMFIEYKMKRYGKLWPTSYPILKNLICLNTNISKNLFSSLFKSNLSTRFTLVFLSLNFWIFFSLCAVQFIFWRLNKILL